MVFTAATWLLAEGSCHTWELSKHEWSFSFFSDKASLQHSTARLLGARSKNIELCMSVRCDCDNPRLVDPFILL